MSGAAHGSSLPTLALCARSLKAPEFNPPFEPPASFAFSWESPSSSVGADFVSARSKSPRPGLRTNGRMVAVHRRELPIRNNAPGRIGRLHWGDDEIDTPTILCLPKRNRAGAPAYGSAHIYRLGDHLMHRGRRDLESFSTKLSER
jgi:hypothetical protein